MWERIYPGETMQLLDIIQKSQWVGWPWKSNYYSKDRLCTDLIASSSFSFCSDPYSTRRENKWFDNCCGGCWCAALISPQDQGSHSPDVGSFFYQWPPVRSLPGNCPQWKTQLHWGHIPSLEGERPGPLASQRSYSGRPFLLRTPHGPLWLLLHPHHSPTLPCPVLLPSLPHRVVPKRAPQRHLPTNFSAGCVF